MTALYARIDLHSNNSVLVVCDAGGNEVYRKRLRNSLGLVAQALEPHRESLCGVVVEATYNWYWLVDGLMGLGMRCTWPIRVPSRSIRASNMPKKCTVNSDFGSQKY